jgi:hypothetical protein
VSLAVIVVFAVENVVRGYLLPLADVVDWWRYPTPLLSAALGLAAIGVLIAVRGSAAPEVLIAVRGSAAPEVPVPPTSHRGWTSFGPRVGIVLLAVTVSGLLATSVAAGLASSADSDGRFVYLELGAPNTSITPLRPWFYGWSYGIPVIVSVIALAVIVWLVLSRSASRPYLRPDGVAAEQVARRRIAAAIVSIAIATTVLALGGVFRFIARSGTIDQVTTGDDKTYELVWRYAALAAAAGWVAPLLEIAGFTVLLLTALRALRRPLPAQAETLVHEVSR